MANIARLPSGSQLLATGRAGRGAYGPHCYSNVVPGVAVGLYETGTDRLLGSVNADGTFGAELQNLSPVTMPYANRFLLSTGSVLIKDWRTGNYRVKSSTRRARKAAALAAQAAPPKVVEQKPAFETAQPKAAVITMAEETAVATTGPSDRIPGMEYFSELPQKGKLKGAGRGWTDVDGIVLRTEDYQTLQRSWSLRQKGKVANVLITGPAGTAKTVLVRAFAKSLGVDFLTVDCSAVRTTDDWSGAFRQDPNTKTWAHQWSPFARALRARKPCVILLDELTRTESPAALNGMLGLLGPTGTLLVTDANDVLRLPDGILVVATANIGPEFVGTLPLDGAVRQRFGRGVRMDYPTEAIEAKLLMNFTGIDQPTAEGLVRMAVQQRLHRDDAQLYPSGNIISTRLLLGMAEGIAEGDLPRDAIWAVLKGQFNPEDDAALSVVVDTQFPKVSSTPSAPAASTPASIVTERHWFNQNPSGSGACVYQLSNGVTCGFPQKSPHHFGS